MCTKVEPTKNQNIFSLHLVLRTTMHYKWAHFPRFLWFFCGLHFFFSTLADLKCGFEFYFKKLLTHFELPLIGFGFISFKSTYNNLHNNLGKNALDFLWTWKETIFHLTDSKNSTFIVVVQQRSSTPKNIILHTKINAICNCN